jgi:hypothetical protein
VKAGIGFDVDCPDAVVYSWKGRMIGNGKSPSPNQKADIQRKSGLGGQLRQGPAISGHWPIW